MMRLIGAPARQPLYVGMLSLDSSTALAGRASSSRLGNPQRRSTVSPGDVFSHIQQRAFSSTAGTKGGRSEDPAMVKAVSAHYAGLRIPLPAALRVPEGGTKKIRKTMCAAGKVHRHPIPKWKDPSIVNAAAAKLLEKPEMAAQVMAKLPTDARRKVALAWAMTELEEEFAKADKDKDGMLSYREFKLWSAQIIENGKERDTEDPTQRQLAYVALRSFVPFVGFGAVDNGLMVLSGDFIDGTFGVLFGISMLAAAALGNAFSNIFGMLFHGTINRWADKVGLPDPRLTLAQRKMASVHTTSTAGSTCGVFIGCLLGMAPLLFMDQKANEAARALEKSGHGGHGGH